MIHTYALVWVLNITITYKYGWVIVYIRTLKQQMAVLSQWLLTSMRVTLGWSTYERVKKWILLLKEPNFIVKMENEFYLLLLVLRTWETNISALFISSYFSKILFYFNILESFFSLRFPLKTSGDSCHGISKLGSLSVFLDLFLKTSLNGTYYSWSVDFYSYLF